MWVDRRGRATPLLDTADDYRLPRSLRTRRSSLSASARTYVIDLERRSRARVTHGTTSALFPFAWSRDSTRVFFSRFENKVGLDIYATPSSGSGPAELVVAGEYRQWASSTSPATGAVALYEQHPTTLRDLWLLQPGGTRTKLVVTSNQERAPKFSPAGDLIAYVSNESGRDEVYVVAASDPGKRSVVSTEGGAEPVWSADGREIFYRNGERLFSAAVTSSRPFTVRPPGLVFEGSFERDRGAGSANPNYDVARDGQRFVMIQAPSAASSLVVVLNWFWGTRQKARRKVVAGVSRHQAFSSRSCRCVASMPVIFDD